MRRPIAVIDFLDRVDRATDAGATWLLARDMAEIAAYIRRLEDEAGEIGIGMSDRSMRA